MNKDAGVTLLEMIAAITVLSLAAISLTEIVSSMLGGWQRAETNLSYSGELYELLETASAYENVTSTTGPSPPPVLRLDDGNALQLAQKKTDKGADCIFDLVGRRCR